MHNLISNSLYFCRSIFFLLPNEVNFENQFLKITYKANTKPYWNLNFKKITKNCKYDENKIY